MNNKERIRFEIPVAALLIAIVLVSPAAAQQFVTKAPTAADWAAMAKLPDFNGVWERGGGGGGAAPRGNAGGAAAPVAGAPRGNQAAPAGAGPAGRGLAPAAGRGAGGGRGGPTFTP